MLAACAGGGGGASGAASGASPAAAAPRAARGNANLITEAEVAAANVTNALEAIQRLRPAMLRARSGVTTGEQGNALIATYVDGVPVGGPEQLVNITALSVKEIRFLNPSDATQRFGTNLSLGAIVVTTKR